jgi:CCR4-NOT transcriptional regulation complex NOT5 subunit
MEEPKTTEEKVDKIWQMLAGVDNDGMYFSFKRLMKSIDDFIANKSGVRYDSCPMKAKVEAHFQEHENRKKITATNKEFVLKKWHAVCAGLTIVISLAFGIINYFR